MCKGVEVQPDKIVCVYLAKGKFSQTDFRFVRDIRAILTEKKSGRTATVHVEKCEGL